MDSRAGSLRGQGLDQLILPAILKLSGFLSFFFPFSVSSPFPAQSTKEHHHLTTLLKEKCVVLAKGKCYLLAWPPVATPKTPRVPAGPQSHVIKFLEVLLLSQSFPIEKMSPEMGQMRVLVQVYHHPSMAKASSIMLPYSLWLDVSRYQ